MLRVFEPNLGPLEANAVHGQVMERRVSPGEKVAEFEAMLCAETGAKHAICCNSGTTALMLAMLARGGLIGRTFHSIGVPSYGFPAAANVAGVVGFAMDIPGGGRIATIPIDCLLCAVPDPSENPIAVFISHNGRTKGWREFRQACLARYAAPIHDAATSLGLFSVDDNDTATLSFSGPKIVTTGQGGAVVTNDDHLAMLVSEWVDHGGGNWRTTRIHEDIGGNFRMSDMNAALGVAQMKRLPELLGIRRERFAWYRDHFQDTWPDGWCMLVRTTHAKECIAALAENGIEALQPYRPVQESLPYRDNPVDPEAVRAADELLYLPVHYLVTRDAVNRICQTIKGTDPCACSN